MAPAADPRVQAVRALLAVTEAGRSLEPALACGEALAARDRALMAEICHGTLRWWWRLEGLLAMVLSRGLRDRDADLRCLLLSAIYQLVYLRAPDYAVVDASVRAVRGLGKPWAAGLVNGVLRNLLRQLPAWSAAVDLDPLRRHSLPAWLWRTWCEDWGEPAAHALAEASNRRAPLWLRVDLSRIDRPAALQRLGEAGLEASPSEEVPTALRLSAPCAVETLPGFAEGWLSVQDAAAQLAAPLLSLAPGQRVLDACAAPGGKSVHLLECQPALGELVALDRDPERLARVVDNLARSGRSATLLSADAGDPAAWWDGRPFDRILLDAPCSGTGVIRRHPDIKWLRRAEDPAALAAAQARLLEALWPLLVPGGMLLYATCSVIRDENADQIARFLRHHPEARALDLPMAPGVEDGPGRQILTGDRDMDGFFYALMVKS